MNYYLDTEFHEYHKQPKCLGVKIGKSIPTIDLISIGIVSEDSRKYYTISKDFNIKDAWNSWQPKKHNLPMGTIKEYWLRENVLKPIFRELLIEDGEKDNILIRNYYKYPTNGKGLNELIIDELVVSRFTLRNFTRLINKYGKTNKEIAKEVLYFCSNTYFDNSGFELEEAKKYELYDEFKPIFYAYYGSYDWVVFAQLFGKMVELPTGFPMYCHDLKQEMDNIVDSKRNKTDAAKVNIDPFSAYLNGLKNDPNYPKQKNEHNALGDAIWGMKLHKFLQTL